MAKNNPDLQLARLVTRLQSDRLGEAEGDGGRREWTGHMGDDYIDGMGDIGTTGNKAGAVAERLQTLSTA
uniref:CsbD family protein n=1 Tax=Heterorhabditis bacteriophora TaxID=37862 RepID=A0A1I7X221_HETBA